MRRVLGRFLWHACDVVLGRSYGHTGDDTQDRIRFQVAVLPRMYPALDCTPPPPQPSDRPKTSLSLHTCNAY